MSDGPDNRPTHELPAVPPWAIELVTVTKQTAAKVDDMADKVDNIERNVELQGGEIGIVKKEIALVYEWKATIEEKVKTHSMRAKSASEMDMSHEAKLSEAIAALSEERAKREELEAKAATKADVDKVLAENKLQTQALNTILGNPMVKRIGTAIGALILLAIAAGTLALNQRIATMSAKVEAQPPVPSVIVVPLFDAGVR